MVFTSVRAIKRQRGREVTAVTEKGSSPNDDSGYDDWEDAFSASLDGADAQTEVVQRETGVRLRTNVQAGSASERVNVTLETHAQTLADLIGKTEPHNSVLSDEVEHARKVARQNNE